MAFLKNLIYFIFKKFNLYATHLSLYIKCIGIVGEFVLLLWYNNILTFKPVTLKTDKSTSAYTQITHEFTWFSKEPISMGGDEKRDSLRK